MIFNSSTLHFLISTLPLKSFDFVPHLSNVSEPFVNSVLDLTMWSVHSSVNSLSGNSCASIMKWRVDAFKWLTLAFYHDTFLSLMTNSRWLVIDENKETLKVEKKRLIYRRWPREGIELESKARLRAVASFDCSNSKIEKHNEAISYGVAELYRSLEMETIILQLCI